LLFSYIKNKKTLNTSLFIVLLRLNLFLDILSFKVNHKAFKNIQTEVNYIKIYLYFFNIFKYQISDIENQINGRYFS